MIARLRPWQHAAVLGVSLLLVALYTYPLVLDPGSLLPKHKDPFMYAWTMVSNVHRLRSAPLAVFHGNTFYPHGNTIAHTDLLLTPMLTAAPIYLLTGNPVLQYNLTLLAWWALSGWAMYVLAFALFRSHPGAIIAALAFTLCPYRTDFFLEFQMQLAFPIPLGLLCFLRFLETRRWRPLGGVVLLLWIEALASMYYAIILGLCLATVAALHVLLRTETWSWLGVRRLCLAGLVLAIGLAPFLVPYLQNRRELGLERELRQPARHSADVLTYFESGVTKLYRFRPSGHVAETSLFMGFVVLALAAAVLVRRDVPAPGEGPPPAPWLPRLLTVLSAGAAVGVMITLVRGEALRAAGLRVPNPERFFDALLALGLARFGVEGWRAARAGSGRHPLGERELRWILWFLVALFFVLSLGPWIHYGRRELGRGLYYHLYPYLLPLHAMRITSRIGVIVVLALGLLAGLGLKLLVARLPGPRSRALLVASAVLLLLAEYRSFPLPYQRVDWSRRPPVYAALAADPEDVAMLEWPQGYEYWDDYYTFMSISHWKRLVNGASGFSPMLPEMTRDISTALSQPDRPDTPFPTPEALRYLLGIYPLRYIVVHNALLDVAEQRKWTKLLDHSVARSVGRFGDDDLYRLTGVARGALVEKFFSGDYARARHEVALRVRPIGPVARERWIEVALNGRPLGRQEIHDAEASVVLPLPRPLHQSAPNTVTIRWRYRGPDTPRPTIGRTGVAAPVDLSVVSAGFDHGQRASILVDGIEYAVNARGYNLVAVDPVTSDVLWAEVFDTLGSVDASRRLAAAVGRLPGGTVVAAAVSDEASGLLTEEAVLALRSLGGSQDIRGHYRVSHLLIGVKGAPPGAALEEVGYARLEATLGTPPARIGAEVRDFSLR